MENCLFCKIIAGDIPSTRVYEDEMVYAFRDINPQAPTHVLVVPKTHVADVADTDRLDDAALAACIRAGFPGASFVITWAPVSRRRLRKRGYDQSHLLAEAAARALGMPCIRLLDKTADTPPQSGLKDPARRRANVAGVYAAVAGAPITGARILVIDDVFTTGATLSECARTLLMAGAERVDCAVLTAKI